MKTTTKSIFAALLSGAAIGIAQYAQAGGGSLKAQGTVAGVGALIGLVNFLTRSPLDKPAAPAAIEAPKPNA